MTQYSALFSPFTLNGLEIPNRIVMAPMTRSHSRCHLKMSLLIIAAAPRWGRPDYH